jgi:hypothetical protein
MKNIFILLILALFFTACTPGIGIGIPVGKIGYVGVGANTNGVHTSAGVHSGPVAVGVSG